jgi:hypothetical protein
MKWTELLFSFRGRIPRLHFLAHTLVFGFAAGILTSTFQSITETYGMGETNPDTSQFEPTGPLSIAIFAVTLANLWVNLALGADRGDVPLRHRCRWPWLFDAHAAGRAKRASEHHHHHCHHRSLRALGLARHRDRLLEGHSRPEPFRPRSLGRFPRSNAKRRATLDWITFDHSQQS